MVRCFRNSLIAASAGLAMTPALFAQANFFESFEDISHGTWGVPPELTQRGWIFRNQSQPTGTRSWFSGIDWNTNSAYFNAQAGQRYLAADEGATNKTSGGQISTWAILPAVQGQQAGDLVKLHARRLAGSSALEIRYSPSGGTGTGSGPAGVGDFTQVLLHVPDVATNGWTAYQANVPGAGRIAIRYIANWQGTGNVSPYTGLDSVSVGPPPPPPCNLPPIPQPGQTVTWTAANSPYQVCENLSIPAGATVNVEPGVTVNFDAMQLNVAGTLNINGTQAQPVTFNPSAAFPPNINVSGGTLNADWAVFNQQVHVSGTVQLRDTKFQTGNGILRIGNEVDTLMQTFAHLERVQMQDGDLFANHIAMVMKDCTLQNVEAFILNGAVDFRGTNTVTGLPLHLVRHGPVPPIEVSNIHATNVPVSGGIKLWGAHALVGPNVVLQNNKYTLAFQDLYMGSIMPGSQLPLTGNQHNVIDVGRGVTSVAASRWSNVGLPYRLTIPNNPIDPDFGPHIIIDPGVRVEHDAGAYLVGKYHDVQLMGLPEAPIEIVPTTPGVPHLGPWYGGAENPKLEYTRFEGMVDGVTASAGTVVWMDNCVLQNNQEAVQMWGTAGMRAAWNQFLNNSSGVRGGVNLNSATNPNSFEGNSVAVHGPFEYPTDARNCWWNSPTGPSLPENPGGMGDPIGGYTDAVQFSPWLTERPDYSNHPPVVRMGKVHGFGIHPNQTPYPGNRWPRTNQGSKTILHWQASDDDQIVSQKLVMTRLFPGSEVVLADNMPPGQRSIEITIPQFGPTLSVPTHLRLYATDTTGKVGWDQVRLNALPVTSQSWLTFDDSMYAGKTFLPGAQPPQSTFQSNVPWEQGTSVYLELDGDYTRINGFVNEQYKYYWFWRIPLASTDRARIVFEAEGKRWTGGYFSIRYDSRLGWTPPVVQMTSPAASQSFAGGSVIPIKWTAEASQGLYGFDIQVSYDGGSIWHALVYNLPASTRSFDWHLPASTGIEGLKIRIIAKDRRFQNSASGDHLDFSITPGGGCYANCDGSTTPPALNVADFGCFLQKFAAGDPYANCDGSTAAPVLNVADFGCFLQKFATGCP